MLYAFKMNTSETAPNGSHLGHPPWHDEPCVTGFGTSKPHLHEHGGFLVQANCHTSSGEQHLTRRFGEPVPRLQRAPLHSRSRSGGPQLSRLRSCAGHVPTSLKDFLSSQSHWAPSLLHPQPENTAPDSAAKPALLQLPTKTSASCLRWLTLTGTGQRLSASRVPSASRQLQCLVGWGGLGRVGQQRFGRVQGDARGGCSCGAGVRR